MSSVMEAEVSVPATTALEMTPEVIEELLRDAVGELVLEGALSSSPFQERVEWRLKPGFNTAAWSYSGSEDESGVHSIYLGTGLFAQARPGLTREEMICYAKAYGQHERDGHARSTLRGQDNVKQLIRPMAGQKRGIPFPLFNLFEDARIEYRWRKLSGNRFNWRKFEEPPKIQAPLRPESILFFIIQSEAEEAALDDEWLSQVVELDRPLAERVADYYARIVAAPDSRALRPVMLEWMAEFMPPEEEQASAGASGPMAGNSELEQGYAMGADPRAKAAFDSGTVVLSGPGTRQTQHASKGMEDSIETEASGSECLLAPSSTGTLDMAEVATLTKRLARAFRSPSAPVESEDSTPSLCTDNLLSMDTRHAAWLAPRRQGVAHLRRVGVVVDCSGSMRGGPMTEARKLVAALSRLAKRQVLSGFVLLTAVEGNRSLWYRMQLPVALKDIERMHAFASAEGIEAALRENVAELARCHRVFLYSDGHICDAQPDKNWLRARGVEVIGLYCGEEFSAAPLHKHTAKVIVRSTPLALADEMVRQLKRLR